MNDIQRDRLMQQVMPEHDCTPYNGACHMPHYWYNHTSPRYLVQWPAPSPARERFDEAREERDWGSGE